MRKILLIASLISVQNVCFATEVLRAKVTKLDLARDYGSYVFIKLDATQTNKPACHQNGGWNYTSPIATEMDKAMFSILLAAYMSGKSISIYGSGACSQFPSIETAGRVRLEEAE